MSNYLFGGDLQIRSLQNKGGKLCQLFQPGKKKNIKRKLAKDVSEESQNIKDFLCPIKKFMVETIVNH